MNGKADNDRALGHLAEGLRAHDWMSTTRALDWLAQSLSEHALAQDFHEVIRVSHLVERQAKQYLLSADCTAEIGRTLASRIQLRGNEIIEVKQPAVLQAVVHNFARNTAFTERVELYINLLDAGKIDLCRALISAQDVEDVTGVRVTGSSGSPASQVFDHWDLNTLTGMTFSSLVHCYRAGEKPEQHWLDLIRHIGPDLDDTIRVSGHGADAPLALKAFGFDDLVQMATCEVAGNPVTGDIGHYEKLAMCGFRLKSADKHEMLDTYKKFMAYKDNSDAAKDKVSTKISSMMALDFDEQGDYAFASAITLMPQRVFDKALCDACNYLWPRRGNESKARLVALLDETYDSPSRVKMVRGLMGEDIYKQLRLGREHAFASDLGL
ncbi:MULTISPECIES: hypothetical protein [Pseudomonas]|uniref:hypothetical protein n=1 Tax=Pseudomonas TaxID=286 RepID=UPI000F02CBB5|nr:MULTISPECIES: hypothetical protein [Pseudomonas]MBD8681220.1 hypothetical protein [Pseudomonas sp. CFBP 13719]